MPHSATQSGNGIQCTNVGQRVTGKCRRRIYFTEEKAKVVAAAWGTELIQFLAALAILH